MDLFPVGNMFGHMKELLASAVPRAFRKRPAARQLMAMGHLAAGYDVIAAMESFRCFCCFDYIPVESRRIVSLLTYH